MWPMSESYGSTLYTTDVKSGLPADNRRPSSTGRILCVPVDGQTTRALSRNLSSTLDDNARIPCISDSTVMVVSNGGSPPSPCTGLPLPTRVQAPMWRIIDTVRRSKTSVNVSSLCVAVLSLSISCPRHPRQIPTVPRIDPRLPRGTAAG